MNFGQRFLEAFENAPIAQIARKLDKTYQAVKNYANGRIPSAEILIEIRNSTNCSIDWLLTGDGPKYTAITIQPELQQPPPNKELPSKKEELFLTSQTLKSPHQPDDASVPLTGTISPDTQRIVRNKESLTVKVPNYLADSNQFRFQIEGNGWSLEGLHDGDLLLARKPDKALDGKLVIAQLPNQKIIVRRYRKVGSMVHFAPIEGRRPVIRVHEDEIRIEYIVTIITRSFE